jgi:hypothetical protein
MIIILSIWSFVLGLAVWQENQNEQEQAEDVSTDSYRA